MRLASYNVENLFVRARALNMDTWAEGKQILEQYVALNELFEEPAYTNEIKAKILSSLKALSIDKKNDSKYVWLRENRGHLLKHSSLSGTTVVARGRDDWTGWLELKTELVNEAATRNCAQVVRDVGADVMAMIEVEDRRALQQFSEKLLPSVKGVPYDQTMLIDGNDERGIDVGILSRYPIQRMRSHISDAQGKSRIFSRERPATSNH